MGVLTKAQAEALYLEKLTQLDLITRDEMWEIWRTIGGAGLPQEARYFRSFWFENFHNKRERNRLCGTSASDSSLTSEPVAMPKPWSVPTLH